jgi:hypothetical protein
VSITGLEMAGADSTHRSAPGQQQPGGERPARVGPRGYAVPGPLADPGARSPDHEPKTLPLPSRSQLPSQALPVSASDRPQPLFWGPETVPGAGLGLGFTKCEVHTEQG